MRRYAWAVLVTASLSGLFQCRSLRVFHMGQKQPTCTSSNVASYGQFLDSTLVHEADFRPAPIKENYVVKVTYVGSEKPSKYFADGAIAYLNYSFRKTGLSFKKTKKNDFVKSDYPLDSLYYSSAIEQKICQKSYDCRYINLFVFEKANHVMGFTHYPHENLQRIFVSAQKLEDPALVHEMGHFFGLLHTFEQAEALENYPVASCLQTGDRICDTPADPMGASFLEDNCTLYGHYINAAGEAFEPDMTNFMSYYGACRHSFSAQQNHRMRFLATITKKHLVKV